MKPSIPERITDFPGKYYLFGPYPPPLGGISVFIYRFHRLLKERGKPVEVVDLARLTKAKKTVRLARLFFTLSNPVFYLNTLDTMTMLMVLLRPFGCQVIYHEHSGRFVENLKGVRKLIFRGFLKRLDLLLLAGEHLKDYYTQAGLKLPRNTQIRNAFLPPPLEDEERIWASYDKETLEFIDSHHPLLVANASHLKIYRGVDLYGLDMCVDLIDRLKKDFPRVGLLFALAEVVEEDYLQSINARIEALGLNRHILIMTGQKEVWPLFKKSDLMIRPTFVDSYGFSIDEALFFGCPAVASDVCKRAEGTHLFRNRDFDHLYATVKEVLNASSR